MLKTYEALLNNNGQLIWLDTPPVTNNAKVLVTIISDSEESQNQGQRRIGSLAGQATILDDINKYDDEVMRLFGFSEEEIAEDMQRRQQSKNLEN